MGLDFIVNMRVYEGEVHCYLCKYTKATYPNIVGYM